MFRFYTITFSRLRQTSSLTFEVYDIVLYGDQVTFEEEQYELYYSAGFSRHEKPSDDSIVFRQFFWERYVAGCSASWSSNARSIKKIIHSFQKALLVKNETVMESHVIIFFLYRLAS